MAPLKIIVIGGGVGGPAAAVGLAQNRHHVTLYEQSTKTSEVGFAFRITPNSELCLKHLGIDVEAGGAVSANVSRFLTNDGKEVWMHRENAAAEHKPGGTSVFAYRPQLNGQLMEAAIASGVTIKTGVKVVKIDIEATSVELGNGEVVSADVIVAADGVNSIALAKIVDTSKYFPKPSSGQDAFRFMIDKKALQEDEKMRDVIDENAHMISWSGNNKRIIVYPVDFDKQINVVCTHPQELSGKEDFKTGSSGSQEYDRQASFETVRSIYSDFEHRAQRLFELADPNGFRIWKLVDTDDLPAWTSNHTALIGDAAHPVLPSGFSGASMAIEDAITLKVLLDADVKAGEIADRLGLYQRIRKPRVAHVRDISRLMSGDTNLVAQAQEYFKFLSSHNAVTHAEGVLAKEKS